MHQPKRIALRFEIRTPESVDLDMVTPVFHRWIQEQKLTPMMIDVADYKHVQEGPGIIMLGHTEDFGIDNGVSHGSDVQGFYYVRKHTRLSDTLPLRSRLQEIWDRALQTGAMLEEDSGLSLEINPARILLTIQDRLVYPFTREALTAVREEIAQFFTEVFGSGSVSLSHQEPDIRYPMTWQIAVDAELSLSDLLSNTGSANQTLAV